VRGRLGAAVTALAALALVGALCVMHAGDVGAAFAAVPAWAIASAVALHLVTLALRSEAWRLTLASAGAESLPRRAVHVANAAAFVAGIVQSQAALPTRVTLLRRLAGARAPRPGQICVADVPIFVIELSATALLVAAAVVAGRGAWWIAPLAVGVAAVALAGARLAPERLARRPIVRGLAVLADRRRRGPVVALVLGVEALTVGRVALVLSVSGLPHGLADVAWVVAAMGVFGLLPIGPGASPGATLAALGASSVGASVAAGLMLGASSIGAVLVYALLVALGSRLRAARSRRERAPARLRSHLARTLAAPGRS
jgi:hypothetical protein